jgi:hypothetical protein
MGRSIGTLRVKIFDFSPERMFATFPNIDEHSRESVICCACESTGRKIEHFNIPYKCLTKTKPDRQQELVRDVGVLGRTLTRTINAHIPHS